jgi:hypothetical protein
MDLLNCISVSARSNGLIARKRGSAQLSAMNDLAFQREQTIFVHPPNKNPSTDPYEIVDV